MIGAVQDWAASLDDLAPMARASQIKKATKNRKHSSHVTRRRSDEAPEWSDCRDDQDA